MKQLPRPEYPLTQKAKEFAKLLVKAWNEERVNQTTFFISYELNHIFLEYSAIDDLKEFHMGALLLELNRYGLVEFNRSFDGQRFVMELILLQELRNAVANDFKVSDYFLTMNVQGNIFIENSHIGRDVNNNAFNSGIIQQNITQIAKDLQDMLGQELLNNNPDLKASIDEFALSTDENRQNKYGKVILELGRCIQHTANATVVIQAISWFAGLFI